jgi:Flp pilus assembly protein TadG
MRLLRPPTRVVKAKDGSHPLRLFRRLEADTGSGLIEYALIFMLFMTMILGIADFGRLLYAFHFVSNTARDATRWAAVNGANCKSDLSCTAPATHTDIENHVTQNVPAGIDSSKLTPTASFPSTTANCTGTNPNNSPGCNVDVVVTYTFNFVFPFVSNKTLTLSSESTTVIIH